MLSRDKRAKSAYVRLFSLMPDRQFRRFAERTGRQFKAVTPHARKLMEMLRNALGLGQFEPLGYTVRAYRLGREPPDQRIDSVFHGGSYAAPMPHLAIDLALEANDHDARYAVVFRRQTGLSLSSFQHSAHPLDRCEGDDLGRPPSRTTGVWTDFPARRTRAPRGRFAPNQPGTPVLRMRSGP